MFLPIGASISLLIMFLFFDSLQMVFAVCTASTYTTIIKHKRDTLSQEHSDELNENILPIQYGFMLKAHVIHELQITN